MNSLWLIRSISFMLLFELFQELFDLYFIQITPQMFILFTMTLYCMSLYGVITNTRNLLFSLICIELMFLSLSLNFIYFSVYFHAPCGQIYALLILGLSAAEAAVGLSLLISAARTQFNVKTVVFNNLRG